MTKMKKTLHSFDKDKLSLSKKWFEWPVMKLKLTFSNNFV